MVVQLLYCRYSGCRRRQQQNKGWCIFHLPGKDDAEESEFFGQLLEGWKRAQDDPDTFEIDFQGFIFPSGTSLFGGECFKKDVNFSRAVFGGEVWFDETKFLCSVRFDAVAFRGGTSFVGATFRDAWFNGATFSAATRFTDAQFGGEADFAQAKFAGNTDFVGAKFNGLTSFDRAVFVNVMFRFTDFLGELRIGALFNGLAIFHATVFQRHTTRPDELSELRGTGRINVTVFDGARVGPEGEVRFIQPEGYGIGLVSFLNADLERFNFQDVEWGTYRGRRAIIEEILMGEDGAFKLVSAEQVRQTYARLRRNQERALRYAEAGDFFVGEMEMRRKSLKVRGWHGLLERSLLWAFSGLSNYGESISKPLLMWTPFVIGVFTVLRIVWREPRGLASPEPLCWQSWQEALWRSVAAFFQLRTPEFPTDVAERIVSLPILGTLFIAIKRKLERRS